MRPSERGSTANQWAAGPSCRTWRKQSFTNPSLIIDTNPKAFCLLQDKKAALDVLFRWAWRSMGLAAAK
jgi:hypothetical protein